MEKHNAEKIAKKNEIFQEIMSLENALFFPKKEGYRKKTEMYPLEHPDWHRFETLHKELNEFLKEKEKIHALFIIKGQEPTSRDIHPEYRTVYTHKKVFKHEANKLLPEENTTPVYILKT